MTPDRWRKLQEVYFNVTVLEPAARVAFLDETCRGDWEMRRELDSLLDCENKIGRFLEQTAIEALVAEYGADLVEDDRQSHATLIGSIIDDRYIVREHIGSGGAGDVYRAVHRLLDTPVAIKRLSRELRNVEEHRKRFVQEARRVVLLEQENVARVKDVVEESDEVFVIMEFIDGETLRARLKRPLSLDEFLDLAIQCGSAVAAAHSERIVHLDLKPENIMITASQKVKVCDFGVARQLSSEEGGEDAHWVFAGTPAYMAPEVIGSSRFDARADIFSLGVVFYEMLTGTHPFRSNTVAATMKRIVNDATPLDPLTNAGIPRRLVRLIDGMLSKDPVHRPSANDVISELEIIQHRRRYFSDVWRNVLATAKSVARRPLAAAALVLLALISISPVILAPDFFKGVIGVAHSSTPKMVAILPFTNVGGDPANQALCDGLVETLATQLAQIERFQNAFRVLPVSELRSEKVTGARQAKQHFGAALAITGSVQRLGASRIRLTVNLVDTTSLVQEPLTIDQDLENVSAIQNAVAVKIAEVLNGRLPENAASMLALARPSVAAAYEPYLRGRGHLQQYQNIADVDSAIELFQQAVDIDKRYVPAYAALGEAHWRKYELTKDALFADLAKEDCQKAVKLDDHLDSVFVTLALVSNGTGRHEDAVAHARRALSIDPISASAYVELAKAYQGQGKLADAESTYQQAIAARPSDWDSHNNLGSFYFKHARFSEAAAQFRTVLDLAPDNVRGLSNLAAAYQQLKQYAAAETTLKRALEIRPTAAAYSNLGTIYYYQLHSPLRAAHMFEEAAKLDSRNYKWWRNSAAAYSNSGFGFHEAAIAAYEKAIEAAERERETNPQNQALLVALADCYAMTGERGRALDYIRQAMDIAPLDTNQMAAVGQVYEEVGQRALAVEWIGRALRGGYSRDLIESSPSLAQLRSDPAFQALGLSK